MLILKDIGSLLFIIISSLEERSSITVFKYTVIIHFPYLQTKLIVSTGTGMSKDVFLN